MPGTDLDDLLYEPDTPVLKPETKTSTRDLNEILLGDDEIGDDDDE